MKEFNFEKYGPLDLAALEIDAWNGGWPDIHLFPEQSRCGNHCFRQRGRIERHGQSHGGIARTIRRTDGFRSGSSWHRQANGLG